MNDTNGSSGGPKGKESKSERFQAIIAAALEEFFEQGFAAARLDSIAERAGVGKGTVYLYFDSKEALFEAAARSIIAPVIDRVESAAFAPQGSAEALLRMLIETFYREVIGTERRRLLRLLIGEGPRFPRLLSFYHGEVVSRGMAAIRQILKYGIERGEFAKTAALDFPQVLVGPAITCAVWKMLFDEIDPIDLDRYCEAHIELILQGLRPRG